MLARMMVSRCCCDVTPPTIEAYWFYGGVTAFRHPGTGDFDDDGSPGTVFSVAYTMCRSIPENVTYGVVYFPILANPGQVITDARFELVQNGLFDGAFTYAGRLLSRSQPSSESDIPAGTLASWLAVTGWSVEPPIAFSFGPILPGGYQVKLFDVTSVVQDMINFPGFVRGASYAAILEFDILPQRAPLEYFNNSGMASGFWLDGFPQPNTGMVQCELIIT